MRVFYSGALDVVKKAEEGNESFDRMMALSVNITDLLALQREKE